MLEHQRRLAANTRRGQQRERPLCGCYNADGYLPQVKIDAHTDIIQYASRTVFTQTFVNPSKSEQLEEINYVFPLYDGVSVVAFECAIGDRIISAVVKEREVANKEYSEAQSEGKTAVLLNQSLRASDVFATNVGNIPSGGRAVVKITYLWELKHDAEIDGIRFTIPTSIAPRYGENVILENEASDIKEEGISVTIDVEMPGDLAIKSVQSPSHPISVSIGGGAETSQSPLGKASVTLSQTSTNLDRDFVIEVVPSQHVQPVALLETHPTIPNQRAVMATLVPKFKLPTEKPEIVFICDRSGSMQGEKIENLVSALNIFLKSLPVGIKFNICSFGTEHTFLWPKSRSYSQETLEEAVEHVSTFDSNYGGTRVDAPMKVTFEQRHTDTNLEVFLLTDGQIWNQEPLFAMVSERVAESRNEIRVFTLGIGSGASTALIEGVARAGNGFAQMVQDSEKMSKKVIRMLKAALLPHIVDYNLKINYGGPELEEEEEDFVMIENAIDSPAVQDLVENEPKAKKIKVQQPISLFDPSFDDNEASSTADESSKIDAECDHLPPISAPSYLQTPSRIPALYPFNRTTIYVMLSDSTPEREPKSVVLKGTSQHGPVELEIPIVKVQQGSSIIHQLAARKEIRELEDRRGWLTEAKDSSGHLLKDKFKNRFSDVVKREAVRLGVKYQVVGRWTSFVGVEGLTNGPADQQKRQMWEHRGLSPQQLMAMRERSPPSFQRLGQSNHASGRTGAGQDGIMMSASPLCTARPVPTRLVPTRPVPAEKKNNPAVKYDADFLLKLRDTSAGTPIPAFDQHFKDSKSGQSGSSRSQPSEGQRPAPRAGGYPMGAFGAPAGRTVALARIIPPRRDPTSSKAMPLTAGRMEVPDRRGPLPRPAGRKPTVFDPSDKLQAIVSLQTFTGSWVWSEKLEQVLSVTCAAASGLEFPDAVANHPNKEEVLATCCAIVFIKKRLKEDVEIWEMLMEKAEGWLEDQVGVHVEELVAIVSSLF